MMEELAKKIEDVAKELHGSKKTWTNEEVEILLNRFMEFIAHNDIETWNNWIEQHKKKS